MSYNPNEIVKDGPFTAPRVWHHILKVLISLALYAILRDGFSNPPWLAALLASPVFITAVAVKEWNRPSDPNERTYSRQLRIEDFMTDWMCTFGTVVLALAHHHLWIWALTVAVLAFCVYLSCRPGSRP